MKTPTRRTTLLERPVDVVGVSRETVALDYPQEGSEITGTHYSFRIAAPEDAEAVELCINQGPWLACRRSSGYWWFDWTGFDGGPYKAKARLRTADGRLVNTLPRHFRVVAGS